MKTALIIGGGPAGLTAAYELLQRTDIVPVVCELSGDLGGLSKTVCHHGNRIDIGGHRFFTKSSRVLRWWLHVLPLQRLSPDAAELVRKTYRDADGELLLSADGPDPEAAGDVMLLRQRRSRIYYNRRLFDYPLSLSWGTLRKLGFAKLMKIGMSYVRARVSPVRPERNLQDFLVNRFGRELFETFFKAYTEKVWGLPCTEISPEWGAQRIKRVSVPTVIAHAIKKLLRPLGLGGSDVETSLIDCFLYPKFGPGQLWERAGALIREGGGTVSTRTQAIRLNCDGARVLSAVVRDLDTGTEREIAADYFFSTMPIKELIAGLTPSPSPALAGIAEQLKYRDFITVGLLLARHDGVQNELRLQNFPDNWIYVQEPGVRIGRVQIFNNWSPSMASDPGTVWVGLEYFCNEGDSLWSMADKDLTQLAAAELAQLGLAETGDVQDAVVIRMPKAYPVYSGAYSELEKIRAHLDPIENLFLIGRNGLHRYNNQDHSMLTAMEAVDNVVRGVASKANIWAVNAESEYHESKKRPAHSPAST